MSNDGGWILPPVIDPPGRLTVCLCIPDEIEHIAAFWGALTELGYQHNWQRDDEHNAVPVSVLWMSIIAEANVRFNQGGLMCFNCDELAECLQPLLNAQTAQFQTMLNQMKNGDPGTPGIPLTPEQTATDLAAGSNPTCDLNVVWAQSLQIVTYTDILITDALQLAESATNDVELLEVISALPGLDEIGVDAIFGYMEMLLEGVQENYYAQITEAYLQGVACELFCQNQDCSITLDRIMSVMTDRMRAHFSDFPSTFATLTDMLAYFVDSDIDGTIIADAMFYVVWGGGTLANTFLGDVGTKPLSTLLKLAVNDANNDWELICDVCPEPEEICGISLVYAAPPIGFVIDTGSDDETGFIQSELLDTGGGETAWIIAHWDGMGVSGMNRIRLVFADNYEKAWQVYNDTTLWSGANVPTSIGFGEYVIDVIIDPPYDGTVMSVNTRQHPIPNATPFKLLRIELCEE